MGQSAGREKRNHPKMSIIKKNQKPKTEKSNTLKPKRSADMDVENIGTLIRCW